MEKTVQAMESDLMQTHDRSNDLRQTIREHEQTIQKLKETEAALLERVYNTDKDLKKSEEVNGTFRLAMETEKAHLASEIVETKETLDKVRAEKEVLEKSLNAVVAASEVDKKKLEAKMEEQDLTIKTLQE